MRNLTLLHWLISRRVRQDILKEKRADNKKQILYTLSGKLTAEFGQLRPHPR